MSEFATCIYLMSNSIIDGVDLMQGSGIVGYVLPPVSGWVTLLPEGNFLEAYQKLEDNPSWTLLSFEYEEDNGLKLCLSDGKGSQFNYMCSWTDTIEVEDEHLDYERLCDILNQNEFKPHPYLVEDLKTILNPTPETLFNEDFEMPAHRFAAWLGLRPGCYYGLSYGNISNLDPDLEELLVFVEEIEQPNAK